MWSEQTASYNVRSSFRVHMICVHVFFPNSEKETSNLAAPS